MIAPLPLAAARAYADRLMIWLAPYVERAMVVGSIRRLRPICQDVDIVCIPKVTTHTDLLGQVVARDNHVFEFLQIYIRERNPLNSPGRAPRFISGGDKEGKQVLLELPKCQLDLWFADEKTWATRCLCRTGSKDHNIWLADRATFRGLHWNPYEGLLPLGHSGEQHLEDPPMVTPTEESIYAALGLAYIEPKDREGDWLRKHIDSGLP
jgi:DNA polymerase/3'-5' exonuclease PolX